MDDLGDAMYKRWTLADDTNLMSLVQTKSNRHGGKTRKQLIREALNAKDANRVSSKSRHLQYHLPVDLLRTISNCKWNATGTIDRSRGPGMGGYGPGNGNGSGPGWGGDGSVDHGLGPGWS